MNINDTQLRNAVHNGALDGANKGLAIGGALVALTNLYGLTHIALESSHRKRGGEPLTPVLGGDCRLPKFSHFNHCDNEAAHVRLFNVSIIGAFIIMGTIIGAINGGARHINKVD